MIKHYHKGKFVLSLSHVTDSLYLVWFRFDGLILWNEQTDQQLSKIFDDALLSIKRVLTTNNYIFKSTSGVEVVTINDFEPLKFSVHHLLDAADL